MKKSVIIGILLLVFLLIVVYRRISCYDNSLVDYATQLMKERVQLTEILKALVAKGASDKDAFDIAKEAEKRITQR